jgi:pyridoxamine 5'-phosphate oxidase
VDISSLRRPATDQTLERKDLDNNPVRQFDVWMQQACDSDTLDPNAMSLATVDNNHRPSSRTVLLKYFDEQGFVFFTNLSSTKATQIAENENVALLFFWPDLGRQVSIRGRTERVSARETMQYFLSRPRGSQIGAWVSAQSSVISSRALLEAKFDEVKRKFANKEVPLPSFWGGYRVVPHEIEFWQGRKSRVHDSLQYTRNIDNDWHIERLAP